MPGPRRSISLAPASAGRIEGPRVGVVVSTGGGAVRVDFEGNRRGPLPARVSAGLEDAALAQAARDRQEGVLLFEDGDPGQPVLIALLHSASPLVDAALAVGVPSARRTARIDGQRVEIEGRDEVVLRCGRASLTLRSDGRVILRGVDVVSQADRVQKVRGGKVQIN